MKQFLLALALMLSTSAAMALETLMTAKDLVEKTKSGIVLVVFTSELKDESWPKHREAIEAYEKEDSEVKFYVATLESEEMLKVAMGLGIQKMPTVLVSEDGVIMTAIAGAATDVSILRQAIPKIKEALKKIKEEQKNAPQEGASETIKRNFKEGSVRSYKSK